MRQPVPVIYQSVFYNLSGYAAESRGMVRELVCQGFAVSIIPEGPGSAHSLPPEEYAWLKGLEELTFDPGAAVHVVAQPPLQVRRPQTCPCAVLRTMFETDRVHPEWVRLCNQFDEVWLPSTQNRDAFVGSGVPAAKARVVRGAIDTEIFRPGHAPLPLARRKDCAFLSVFDWHWRKGWDLLVTAYCQEFGPEEPVTLYLKVNQLSQKTAVVGELHFLLRRLYGHWPAATPDIVLLDQPLPEAEMPRLYAAADAFVLPTRGEGYGRPFLEAMACGLPVIGTAWGGQADFLTEETGYPVPLRGLEPVADFEAVATYRGLAWAAPDVAALRRLMRHVFAHRDEARQKAAVARQVVEEGWDYRPAGRDLGRAVMRLAAERGLHRGRLAAT